MKRILEAMLLTPLLTSLHWNELAPLPQARAGCAAGVLNERMVVAGGSYWAGDKKYWSDRTDVYDPAHNTWSEGPSMPEPRSDAASATLRGNVYVLGGVAGGALSADVLRFDGRKWTRVSEAKLPNPLMYAVAEAVNGRILLLGGLTTMGDLSTASRAVWSWSESTGWVKRTDFPGTSRVSSAVAARNGKLYVFGGVHQETSGGPIANLQDAWVYDVNLDRWSELPKLPVARRAWSGVSTESGIYLIGGYTDAFSAEVFAFDEKSKSVRLAGALPHALADARFVRIGARILTAGGESGNKIRSSWTLEGKL